jgi:hypothetical protein
VWKLALPLVFLTTACDAKDDTKAVDGDAKLVAKEGDAGAGTKAADKAAAAVARVFPKELRKKPCTLLTPEMVGKIAKVDANTLTTLEVMGMCIYEWEGGKAQLGFIRIKKSAEDLALYWENGHKNMSGEEIAAAMAKIGDAAEKKLSADAKAGTAKADAKNVKPVTNALSGAMKGGIQWERIEGIGDAAAFETTRSEIEVMGKKIVSYANGLDVRIGNMSFGVSFDRDGEPKMYKDENIALAREVIAKLP